MYKYQQLKDKLWGLYGIYATPSELCEIVESLKPKKNKSYIEQALQAVCLTYGIDKKDIQGKCRKTPLPEARKVFCFLCASRFLNHGEIARAINLDRSTVSIHSKEVYKDWPRFNKEAVMRLNLVAEVLGLPDQLKFVKASADL